MDRVGHDKIIGRGGLEFVALGVGWRGRAGAFHVDVKKLWLGIICQLFIQIGDFLKNLILGVFAKSSKIKFHK